MARHFPVSIRRVALHVATACALWAGWPLASASAGPESDLPCNALCRWWLGQSTSPPSAMPDTRVPASTEILPPEPRKVLAQSPPRPRPKPDRSRRETTAAAKASVAPREGVDTGVVPSPRGRLEQPVPWPGLPPYLSQRPRDGLCKPSRLPNHRRKLPQSRQPMPWPSPAPRQSRTNPPGWWLWLPSTTHRHHRLGHRPRMRRSSRPKPCPLRAHLPEPKTRQRRGRP